MAETTWSLEEVAAELHVQPADLRRAWRRLHRREGFPRPLPTVGGRDPVWSKLLVRAWVNAAQRIVGGAANDDGPAGADAAALIAAQRAALRRSLADRA